MLRAGPGERHRGLADAIGAARDGDTIELLPGDYHGEVAVIEQARLTVRGLGRGAVLHADGRHAEGKAILVVRGGDVELQNLSFRGCRVPDGNGAGVRFERGRLRVLGCHFHDNEMGLLTANRAEMELEVLDCSFGAAPRHAGPLHHLLYVGSIGGVLVQGCKIEEGFRGHLLKSRAHRSRVLGNWLVDGPQGQASYELEFPEGGDNLVAGNVIAQSAATQNPALISMGAEAGAGRGGELRLLHNTLVNHGGADARFLQWWGQKLAADSRCRLRNNLLIGPGRLELPPGADEGGNERLTLEAVGPGYRLPRASPLARGARPPAPGEPPLRTFRAPLGSVEIGPAPPAIGAFQPGG